MRSFYDLMGVPPSGFDPEHRFLTSWLFSPTILASWRLLYAVYCAATIFTEWGWYGTHQAAGQIGRSFSYFTQLTYWGLLFYALTASIHGFKYARSGYSWLNRWPRPLQLLHSFYYTTVVTLPPLVTIVYWVVLFSGQWYALQFNAWSNISKHGLNSLLTLTEIFLTSTHPPPLLHLPFLWIILLLYLGLAYLTHATQGWYTYAFLDPEGGRRSGRVAAYAGGIAAAILVLFILVWLLIWLRRKLTGAKVKRSRRDMGSGRAGFFDARDDVEMTVKP